MTLTARLRLGTRCQLRWMVVSQMKVRGRERNRNRKRMTREVRPGLLLELGTFQETISCSPVSLSPFSARIRSCTYTSFPCRFNAAERKALAIAKKESRRDNTTKSYASHQERFLGAAFSLDVC